jgi:hypothetical protein
VAGSLNSSYPARLDVDYPDARDRLSVLLRLVLVIPILVVIGLIQGGSTGTAGAGDYVAWTGASAGGIAAATALMLLFRQRYPRWWFDFQLEFARFSTRVGAYFGLLRDEYPSTEDEQGVHLELDYPDAGQLSRWLPLVKWLLAIPHYLVLFVLGVGLFFAIVFSWFAILLTGRIPRGIFDFAVGWGRWALRVQAYAFLMLTDRYPPFSLK